MTPLAYPATQYDLPLPPDLANKSERERLSAPGLRAFSRIMEHWGVRDEDARVILGGIANGLYYAMKKAPEKRALDADILLRISYVIGIFKALHILHSASLANEWVRLPNANRIFGGATPLAYMLSGGIPALQTVRRLLDARRGSM